MNITNLRPVEFDDVIGNEKVINVVKNFLENRFPEFSIFVGAEGIGKTTISKLIAKSLSCTQRFRGLPCNSCDTCLEIDDKLIRNNKDVANIRTFKMSDEGGKNAAREIKEFIRTKVRDGQYKVIILEECQGMRFDAQDLLLPELEYIPENTKIIALTTDENRLQGTFKSRANMFRMKVPERRQVVYLLDKICNQEGIQIIGQNVLPLIVEYADNKPRYAIKTLHTLTGQGNKLDISIVNNILNIVDELLYMDYLNILRGDMGLVLDFVETLADKEIRIIDFVIGLNKFLVTLLTFRYRKTLVTPDLAEELKKFISQFEDFDLMKIQAIIAEETPVINNEDFAKFQFISMSFKLMNRNNKELIDAPLKREARVAREQEMHVKNVAKELMEREKEESRQRVDLTDNPNAFLTGMEAFRIDAGLPKPPAIKPDIDQ